jgi:hypothetical protein
LEVGSAEEKRPKNYLDLKKIVARGDLAKTYTNQKLRM